MPNYHLTEKHMKMRLLLAKNQAGEGNLMFYSTSVSFVRTFVSSTRLARGINHFRTSKYQLAVALFVEMK